MLHLTAERLAALADEQPNEIEAAHLVACPRCCHERDAQLLLRQLARREADRPATPLTTWEGIEAALAVDARKSEIGNRNSSAPTVTSRQRRAISDFRFPALARRLAAAAALLATGLAAGRYSAGASPIGLGARAVGDTVRVDVPMAVGLMDDSLPTFGSATEALTAMSLAERQYQLAATFLAAHDSSADSLEDSPAVYRARLAALDGVMAATRTALYEAPQDPVINRYYLATLGARELTVRQLNTALPPGQSVSRF
jgi:hypothetical protein